MTELIGACGLSCTNCEGYKVTQAKDDAALAALAAKASEQFGEQISPDSLRCDGCLTGGVSKCGYCGICQIRKCAIERKVDNCALCSDYGCETMAGFVEKAARAKENLERIRQLSRG